MYLVNVSSTSGIDLFYFHNHLSRNLKRSHISNLQIHEKHMHSSKDRFATEYFGFDCAGMVRASVVNKIFHTPTPPGVKAQSTQVHSLWVTLLSSPRSWHSIGTRKPFPAWQRQTWTLEKSHKIHDVIFSWKTLLINFWMRSPEAYKQAKSRLFSRIWRCLFHCVKLRLSGTQSTEHLVRRGNEFSSQPWENWNWGLYSLQNRELESRGGLWLWKKGVVSDLGRVFMNFLSFHFGDPWLYCERQAWADSWPPAHFTFSTMIKSYLFFVPTSGTSGEQRKVKMNVHILSLTYRLEEASNLLWCMYLSLQKSSKEGFLTNFEIKKHSLSLPVSTYLFFFYWMLSFLSKCLA